MSVAIYRPYGYWVEPTPATLPLDYASPECADFQQVIEPLPPVPKVSRMTQVATPSPPSFPWVFVFSSVFLAVLGITLVNLAVGR
jgi:hypothetical protein